MLDAIAAVPARITALKRKLAARQGKKEYAENCAMIRDEIARLEAVTLAAADAVASGERGDIIS